jgi:hypothetical protein
MKVDLTFVGPGASLGLYSDKTIPIVMALFGCGGQIGINLI